MAQNALAVVQPMATSIHQEKEAWTLMRDQAAILIKTGFLPKEINTPEKAIAVMMKGRELGVPSMYALSHIVIVNGKPTCSAELMLALIRRDHGPQAMRVKSSTNSQCVVEWRTPGWDGTQTYAFSMDDAKQAGLVKNATWTAYPAAMLRARCISAVARMAFPDSIAGMYTPGELGESVLVTDDGEVLSESVDTETGEIIDAEATSQTIPADREDAPGRNIPKHYQSLETQLGTTPQGDGKERATTDPNARTSGGASVRSLNYSLVLADEAGVSADDIHRWTGDQFGRVSRNDLDQRQMSALITWLQEMKGARQEEPEAAADEPADLEHDEDGNLISWTGFWVACRALDVKSPAEYEAKVGAKQTAYPSPAAALAALKGSERV